MIRLITPVLILTLLVLAGCSQAESVHTMTSSALFRDRCVMGPGMNCDEMIYDDNVLTLSIINERYQPLLLDKADVYVLGRDTEKMNVQCRFSEHTIERGSSFELTCDLDEELISELTRGIFRFYIDAFEGYKYEDITIEGDIYLVNLQQE